MNVNLGAIATEVYTAPPIAQVASPVAPAPHPVLEDLDLAQARALVTAAFARLDETFDPPVREELHDLRALAEPHFDLLLDYALAEIDGEPLTDEARRSLIESFLAGPYSVGLSADAEDIAETICDFAGHADGDPVALEPDGGRDLLADWLPRKVVADDERFANVAPVLRAWTRSAGDHKQLDIELVDATVAAIDQSAHQMHHRLDDQDRWGPAKQIAHQLDAAGIDLSDHDAVQPAVGNYNASLALDPAPVDNDLEFDLGAAEDRLLEQWEHFDGRVAELVCDLLADHRDLPPPEGLAQLAAEVRAGLQAGGHLHDDLVTLTDLSTREIKTLDDVDLLLAVTGAWIAPDGISASRAAIDPDRALDSRIIIEQAKGYIRHNRDVDMEPAFNLLRGYARAHSRRLIDVAAAILDNKLPPSAVVAP